MPQMGVSVAEGTIVAWCKAVGDSVAEDETVCEITTDKIDTEVPAPMSGTLSEILVEVGTTVDVGTPLARIVPDNAVVTGRAPDANPPVAADSAGPPSTSEAGERRRVYSPVARRIAKEHGVDLAEIRGTGRHERVTKADVEAFISAREASTPEDGRALHSDSPYRPDSENGDDDLGGKPQPLSRMRKSIGVAMLRSQELAATCTTVVECDFSLIEQRRRALGVTALPLVAASAIETLREFPNLNATLEGDVLTVFDRVHLGIAVSLGSGGLIVPVIHDAQNLSAEGLAERIRAVAARARAGELVADDVRGATFTITNPGAFGALIATPIINVPQVAILDLEAIVRRPVIVADEATGTEAIAIRSIAYMCMSWDHRALDGVYAAQFLTALRRRLEGRASA
jgi:pyruvate/2-oxoglutarate dehydrogenase complex dihydrolipoamide acyltransferase (E2) component